MKVSELSGAVLDFYVGKAEGKNPIFRKKGMTPDGGEVFVDHVICDGIYRPSTDWSQGGPIIERERIMLEPVEKWVAHAYAKDNYYSYHGDTPLIAAMRAYVAGRFGKEVDDSQTHHD